MIEALGNLKPRMHPHGIRQGHPLGTGLIFYLPFWDTGGPQVQDVAGYRHHATRVGDTAWRIGTSGRELYFPGTDDYCTIAHSDRFTLNDFTIAAMVDPDVIDTDRRYIYLYDGASKDGFFIGPYTTDAGTHRLVVFVNGANAIIESNAGVAKNSMQMVVARRMSGVLNLFVDGVKQAATDTLAGEIDSSDPIYLGIASALNNDYAGSISLAALWGMALLDRQIQEFSADPYALIRPPRTMLITWGAQAVVGTAIPVFTTQYHRRRAG